jgi:hypothetical protein
MATELAQFTILYPDWYDDRAEFEAKSKGYLPGIVVQLADGSRHALYFIEPVRLGQDLQMETEQKRPYLAEPGMVVIPEVSTQAVQTAVAGLFQDGYFDHLKPTD